MFHVNNNTMNKEELNYEKKLSELRTLLKSKCIGEQIAFEDLFLLKFLKARDFDVKETCQLITMYLTCFQKHAEFFQEIDFSKNAIEDGLFYVFPKRTAKGESIAFSNFGQWDTQKVTFKELMASYVSGCELLAMDRENQENGIIQITNMEGLGWKHISKLGVSGVITMINVILNNLPLKYQKIIIVGENSFINIMFEMAQPVLRKEIKEKMLFIGTDFDKLYEYVSRDILPAKFGGYAKDIEYNNYYKTLKDNEQWLLHLWKTFKVEK